MDGHTEARKIKLQTLRWRKEKRTFEQKQIVLLLRMCGVGPGLLTVGSPQTNQSFWNIDRTVKSTWAQKIPNFIT